jgi:heptosyltransferase-2
VSVGWLKQADRYLGAGLVHLLGFLRNDTQFTRPNSILFVQLWGIGETICTLPAILLTRKRYPKARIDVLVTSRSRPVYENVKTIDEMHEVKTGPLSVIGYCISNYNRYDIVIDLEEYLNVSAMLSFFAGRHRIGYSHDARAKLYDQTAGYNDRQHVVDTFIDLAALAGAKGSVKTLPHLEPDAATKRAVANLFKLYKVHEKQLLVGMGTGAAESSKCRIWPHDRFASLADMLIEKHKATIVFFGTESEAGDIDTIMSLMKHEAINLAGKTTVPQLFQAVSKMKLVVSNDTGTMHIAAAQGVKTIGLFGPNLPERFGPFGPKNHAIYKPGSCEYSPCINVHKGETPDCLYPGDSDDYQKCMKAIEADEVMRIVSRVIA